jgi:hypothetical protein
VQVPKQGRNLRRESAFYVALVAQVPDSKGYIHAQRAVTEQQLG